MWGSEMFDKDIPDEWTLIRKHGGPRDARAKRLLEHHWETFVTEDDLDRLHEFGVSHTRIPLGYWLVDYEPGDGFVDGGKRYLTRLLGWLRTRGMRALLDLHAMPCGQVANEGFTGRRTERPRLFSDVDCYGRGKRAILELAKLIAAYEADERTSGVVMGMGLLNEPDWSYWNTNPGIKELYRTMVPEVRRLLPANRYSLHLSFSDMPRGYGAMWLALMRELEPLSFQNVVYDVHLFHSNGDDNAPGRKWRSDVDSCKTCCRDPQILAPLVVANLSIVIAEYSLNTGFHGDPDFWREHFRRQLSLWRHSNGVLGSFFWNHRILIGRKGYFKELSLLDLIAPKGPLPPVSDLDVGRLCPGHDLSKCPKYDIRFVAPVDPCKWQP